MRLPCRQNIEFSCRIPVRVCPHLLFHSIYRGTSQSIPKREVMKDVLSWKWWRLWSWSPSSAQRQNVANAFESFSLCTPVRSTKIIRHSVGLMARRYRNCWKNESTVTMRNCNSPNGKTFHSLRSQNLVDRTSRSNKKSSRWTTKLPKVMDVLFQKASAFRPPLEEQNISYEREEKLDRCESDRRRTKKIDQWPLTWHEVICDKLAPAGLSKRNWS